MRLNLLFFTTAVSCPQELPFIFPGCLLVPHSVCSALRAQLRALAPSSSSSLGPRFSRATLQSTSFSELFPVKFKVVIFFPRFFSSGIGFLISSRTATKGRSGGWKMAAGKLLVCFLVLLFAVVYRAGRIGVEAIQLDNSIVGYSPEDLNSEERLVDLFQSWMLKHEKSYESVSEMYQRFAIFKDNLRYIHSHNVQESTPSYSLGLNNLADLTHEEFKTRYLGTKPPRRSENYKLRKTENFIYGDVDAPVSIDWRSKGAVTAIKNQGACGESSSSEL